ncbi:MAG TPA: LppX_LprAFG lipoprotein, partial [Acidimicrobiales bacterium]|nr:LppX_LprAFG lipoprotein [Acidimicrobiales bacterium]
MPTRRSALAVGAAILVTLGSACGARPEGTPGPASLLLRARSLFESTHAVHFSLASTGASGSGAQLVGGQGDLVRPEDVRGAFTVAEDGVHASVKVLAVGGHFYAELPFTSHYTTVDPSHYGISDPAALLSPKG